jgi:hypothetical protein
MKKLALLALALATVTLAVAGCGSGTANSTASTAATAPSTAPTSSQAAPTSSQTTPTSSQTAPSTAPTTATPAPSAKPKGPVAIRADAICGRRNRELVAATSKTPSLPGVAKVGRRRIAIERAELAELGKLSPPAAIARDWREFIAAARRAVQDLAQVVAGASRSELAQVNSAGHLYAGAVSESHAAAQLAALGRCAEY